MLNELARDQADIIASKGFNTITSIHGDGGEAMLAKLMLVTTEVSEAAQAVRRGDVDNFAEELADIVLRVLAIAAPLGIDMDAEVARKMDINRTRPAQHDKKVAV